MQNEEYDPDGLGCARGVLTVLGIWAVTATAVIVYRRIMGDRA